MIYRSRILAVSFLAAFSLGLSAQNFENGVAWNMPWNDTTTAHFLPAFDQGPIGDADRVWTDGQGSFTVGGQPYRFFGGNLTTDGAFPSKSDAPLVAGRMAKYGLNLIRFHHIDNPWGNGSLFDGVTGTRSFNTTRLDQLEYLISQLKKNGVYVNMNLNVSRTFEDVDGVIAADALRDYGKGVTQFDPYMIMLQKEYARDLLTHVNPYTGMALVDDPVLAMVEIINENTLYRMWYQDNLQPISEGGNLPTYYSKELDSLWMDDLEEKYASTAALKAAWNSSETEGDTLFLGDFEDGNLDDWTLELSGTAQASAAITADAASGTSAVRVEQTASSSESWHMQFKLTSLSMKKDSIYELHFKAKTDADIPMSISIMKNVSPYSFYLGSSVSLATEYQDYVISIKAAEDVDQVLRISFSLNNQLGSFYLDDVVFKEQSKEGLGENENLEARTIRRLPYSEVSMATTARVHDLMDFYTQLQLEFLREMKTYLVDTLGVQVPVTGSNWFTGPEMVYVHKEMDFIDNHSYWDHPHFPNVSWDPNDWTINNKPMLTASSATIESHFAGTMVKDKPYTISEYNHASPNQYQAELFPLITSYMSFNAADGLMMFTYSGSANYQENKVDGYFDIHRNPVLMPNFALFSYAFRNRLISESTEITPVDYSYKDVLDMPAGRKDTWSTYLPYSNDYAYGTRMEISFDNAEDFDQATLPPVPQNPYSPGEEIYWDKSGIFTISTPQLASITGYLQNFAGTTTDMMTLVSGDAFEGVHWLSLDGTPLDVSGRSILNVGTCFMNEGMIWDGTTTVHSNWGSEPVQFYPGDLTLKLKSAHPYLLAWRLDASGQVDSTVMHVLKTTDGYATFHIDMETDQTLWYGIEGIEHSPYDTLYCRPIASPPVIDGEVDASWEMYEAVQLSRVVSGTVSSEDDHHVSLRAAFDHDSLYFLAEIRDDVRSVDAVGQRDMDNLELMFDMDNNGIYEGHEGLSTWVWNYLTDEAKGVSAQQDMDGGWRLEIAIPFEELAAGFDVRDSLVIGFESGSGDNDSDHLKSVLAWHDGSGQAWQDAGKLGALLFNDLAELQMSDDGELMEGYMDGEEIRVFLENDILVADLNPAAWGFPNMPAGVEISSVDRVGDREVLLTLTGEFTETLSEPVELTLEVATSEFSTYKTLYARSTGGARILLHVEKDPVVLPLDFESATARYEWIGFSGGSGSVIDNPIATADNPSTTVSKLVKGEGSEQAGTWIALDEPVDFSELKGMSLKIFSRKIGIPVTLKVENLMDADIVHEATANVQNAGVWDELVFDFRDVDAEQDYRRIVLIFEPGTLGNGTSSFTYYVDDIALCVSPTNRVPGNEADQDGVEVQSWDGFLQVSFEDAWLGGQMSLYSLDGSLIGQQEIHSNMERFPIENRGVCLLRVIDRKASKLLSKKVLVF